MRLLASPVLLGLLVLAACHRAPPRPHLPPGVRAHLTARTLTVELPLVDSAAYWLAAGQRFHWRIVAVGPVEAAAISYELHDSLSTRPPAPAESLIHGHASRCEPRGHMLLCGWRLSTQAALRNGRLIVAVQDSATLAGWQAARPTMVHRGVWLGARPVRFDTVALETSR